MIKVDYRAWQAEFDKQVKAQIQVHDKIQAQAVHDFREIVEGRTPIGRPETWKSNPPPGYTPGQARDGWYIEHEGNIYIVANDVVYIQRLEEGWSGQAPAGMLRVTMLEWNQIVQKAAKKFR